MKRVVGSEHERTSRVMTASRPVVCPLPAEVQVTGPFAPTVTGVEDLGQSARRQRPVGDTEEPRPDAEGHGGPHRSVTGCVTG